MVSTGNCCETSTTRFFLLIRPDTLQPNEKAIWNYIAQELKGDIRDIVDITLSPGDQREKIYIASSILQARLQNILIGKGQVFEGPIWKSFLEKLGLTDETVSFEYNGKKVRLKERPKLEVHKVRPVYRVGREKKIIEQILITLTQTLRFADGELKDAVFRGGCTLILNMSGDYEVQYIVRKNIQSKYRFTKQMNYQTGKTGVDAAFTDSIYEGDESFRKISFSQLHDHAY